MFFKLTKPYHFLSLNHLRVPDIRLVSASFFLGFAAAISSVNDTFKLYTGLKSKKWFIKVAHNIDIKPMEDVYLSIDNIVNVINHLPLNSSPGSDEINSRLLRLTKDTSAEFLLLIFEQSLKLSLLPSDWLNANVVSIFKSGNLNDLNTYRPISLTTVSCKLSDHIVFTNIMSHLNSNNLLFSNQNGFSKNLSCITQLFELTNDLHTNLHSSKQTDAIFKDFSKAFDRVLAPPPL